MSTTVVLHAPAPAGTLSNARAATAGAEMYALDFLRVGVFAVMLAYMPGELLFLDRHSFPAEFVLHAFAFGALAACAMRARVPRLDAADLCLAGFLALAVLSAAGAANGWFALRAASLSLSGAVVFWTARALARGGWREPLLRAAGAAVAVLASTALLEAYGVLGDISALNRGPGGTVGHRNQMAHLLVLGLPVFLLGAARAARRHTFALYLGGTAVIAAALTLSRSRGAWLAVGLGVAVAAVALFRARGTLPGRFSVDRAGLLAMAALVGVGAAVTLPNQLDWRSDAPYADSFRGILNTEYGSGHGRLIQYGNTLRMAADHPVLGVGPGNWAIAYPGYASPNDPSVDPRSPLPAGRLPQSDWFGTAAERGIPALLLLAAAGVALALGAWRRLAASPERAWGAAALLSTLAVMLTVGTVDPVLLTPSATFLFFLCAGALAPRTTVGRPFAVGPWASRTVLALLLGGAAVSAGYAGMQAWAGHLYATGLNLDGLARATRLNPGDYRAHMLLAEAHVRGRRCGDARPHLAAAKRLHPAAPAVDALAARCEAPIAAAR